ncbi:hypothetical protein Tco_0439318 [Tanacetum coccineum]
MRAHPLVEYPSLIPPSRDTTSTVGRGIRVREEPELYTMNVSLQRLAPHRDGCALTPKKRFMALRFVRAREAWAPSLALVKMMMRLFRSDDKFSQMLSQFESSTEFGGASGSGRCGDDEPGGDEDGDEDDEDEEDGDS